jgi:TetR/AcrR family transcriptional regulator, repressor of fatR-cypB operon
MTTSPKPSQPAAPARPSQAGMRRGASGAATAAATPGQSRPTDKREAIVAAALELFVERGFYGTTVPEIADHAAVGAGTIYRYFESKEALVNALYRDLKLQFARAVLDDFPAGAPTRELFRTLWSRMAAYASRHPQSFVFMELHHHARYLDAESRAVEQRMLDLITSLIARAQQRGDLKSGSPQMLIGLVMGAFVGVIRSCLEQEVLPGVADWELAERCMWEAIRG